MDQLAKADAIAAVDDLITYFNSASPKEADENTPNNVSVGKYMQAYFGMESLLEEIFTSRDALKFRWNMYGVSATSTLLDTVPTPKSNAELKAQIAKAVIHGEVYKRKLAFWPDEWTTSAVFVSKTDATAAIDELISHFTYANPYGKDEETPDQYDIEEYMRGYFGLESLGDEFFSDTDSIHASYYQIGVASQLHSPTTNAELRALIRQGLFRANVYRERIQDWPSSGFEIIRRRRTHTVETAAKHQVSPGMVVYPIPLYPRVKIKMDRKRCFVLMPFATQFNLVYTAGIKPAVEGCGLICTRGDDIQQPGTIVRQIWGSLVQSYLIIADLTGSNGNVLYELGLAHVIGHEAILLTQSIEDVPFDLRQQRHIVYSTSDLPKLRTDLEVAVYAAIALKQTE